MITKIKEIKDFGIYKDYKWNDIDELKPFNKKNIIYGWNYSGKTTLSRIFTSLRDKSLHKNFKSAKFKIEIDNQEYTQDNLDQINENIYVFNAEYIQENLKWEQGDELDAIAFDVGENVEIRDKINQNIEIIDNINGTYTLIGRKSKYQEIINMFNDFENNKFSQKAKSIKDDIFNSIVDFNKGHLKKTIPEVAKDINSHIITNKDDVKVLKQLSISINDKSKIDNVYFNVDILNLYEDVKDLLETKPPKEEVIDILEKDSELYVWAKDGYKKHKENEFTECAFCNNKISNERLELLLNYFSNQSGKLRKEIELKKVEIQNSILELERINIPKSKNDLIEKYHNSFVELDKNFKSIKKNYKVFLEQLFKGLEEKENGNIFVKLDTLIPFNSTTINQFNEWINQVNLLINSHNDFINSFEDEQKKARKNLINHLVAEYLKAEKYFEQKLRSDWAKKHISGFNRIIEYKKTENVGLEAQLKSVIAGKEEINKFIKAFLNREDISIEVTDDDRFKLMRGDKVAENLSEGEKTAISFAYFLTKLESLHRENKLIESIVFIDDPISSLDANHIAHIYSLINSFFFRKLDNQNSTQVTDCFKQLFISTHNFEFFSFLKDSYQFKKNNCEYFFVKRIEKDKSSICPLPKNLKKKSEYVYLFDVLNQFYLDGCPTDAEHVILIPNALRRFLEMYTLIKLPGSSGEIDQRLSQLMGGQHNLKVLHHFSHFTTFEKVIRHDEMIMNLPQAVNELMELMKKDIEHLDSLRSAL
ncbi:AAA family ATPase [Aliarcobacter butzleri]|uniref:Protein CR006 P-loop domain-containing protein n=1 Tax=Aliarcobacter butzleri L355 TaxID=1447263 RepID=A0A0G9KY49_9BACT|nr:AAA family ATPase [Aliarcobacter butzleri]KLE11431.1 hypothetical protein AF80_01760 [Aliarcobacter butzleri L355]MDH1976905.1 AAA family ATPase [Aliarcobacter butzleri]